MKDSKSYRIRTKIGSESDNVINVQLEQTFDTFEILSLKLDQKNTYKLYESDYGVIVGRVLANGGFGVPNAKVSVFIESEEDEDFEKRLLYPYKSTMNTNADGVRYNLLPDFVDDACHQNVGTFPNKRLVLDNNDIIEIFDKYYVYTTVTNNAGDYMIFGVPTGGHTIHVDLDLSDIGMLSQRPRDMIYKGYNINNFDSPNKFKKSTNLDTLAQIYTQDKGVYVYPFWGDTTDNPDNIAITRCDIELGYKFEPTCVFMGSIVTDTGSNSISKACAGATGSGKMSELVTGEGTIEMIRKTIDNKVESFQIRGNRLIDGDGVWCYQIPMNLDYIMTDEFGNIVPSDNPEKGIPTRTRVRFRISLDKVPNDNTARNRCQYLVPNNPRLDQERYPNFTKTKEVDYEFGTATKDENYRDLLWNKVYTVKNYIPRLQKNTWVKNRKHTGIKLINHFGDNNPMPYNNLTIKLTFTYRLICVIAKAFINLIVFLNQILTLISYPFCLIASVFGGICKTIRKAYGWPIIGKLAKIIGAIPCTLYDAARAAVPSCISISSDFCGDNVTHNNTFYPGCGNILFTGAHMPGECIREKTSDHHIDREKKDKVPEEERTEPSFATGELYNCVESALAEDHDVVSFNFHNDWINGVLYAPLWFRKITPKKRLLFGLIKRDAKDQWCSSESIQSKKLKIFSPCAVRRDKEQRYDSFDGKRNKKAYFMDKTMTCGKDKTKQQCLNERAFIGLMNGIIVKRKTILDEDVYYYQAAEYDHDERTGNNAIEGTPVKEEGMNGAVKLLFATDIVLLGSLNDCDLQGVPQFFKSLEDTTYKMPPTLLFTDNIITISIDEEGHVKEDYEVDWGNLSVTQESKTEMTGADWGNSNEDICTSSVGEKSQNSGLFYSIGCNSQRTLPKSCINLSRICEFGVSLDESKDVLSGEPTENGTYDDFYQYLVPDGFISKDELYNIDERSAFASLNINGLKTKLDDETGLMAYDFDYLYTNNFDNSLRSHMEEQQKKCSNSYKYNYFLEEFSPDYYEFRMGTKPYFYDDEKYNKKLEEQRQPTGRRLPRYENSFYFYFGLKHGKTALDKFNSQFFSVCYDEDEEFNPISIMTLGNDWCSDLMEDERTGYVAFDISNIDLPCDIVITGIEYEVTFSANDEKFYLSANNQTVDELEKMGYKLKILSDFEDNFFKNGTYDVVITDKSGEIFTTSFKLQSVFLQSNVVGTNFEHPDNILLKMFNGSREAIKKDKTGLHDGRVNINDTREIGGTIAISAPYVYNKEEDKTEKVEFYQITIQGIKNSIESFDYNVVVSKKETFDTTGANDALLATDNSSNPNVMIFGVPKPNECYTITVTQLCFYVTYQLKSQYGGPTAFNGIVSPKEYNGMTNETKLKYERVEEFVESGNRVTYTVCIKEKQPFKLYINDVDYDLISDWDCGFKNGSREDISIQASGNPSDNWIHMSDENRYRWYNYIPYQKLDEQITAVSDQIHNLLPEYGYTVSTFADFFTSSYYGNFFSERYGSGTSNNDVHMLYHISIADNTEDEKDVSKRSEFKQIYLDSFIVEIDDFITERIGINYTYVSENYVSTFSAYIALTPTITYESYEALTESQKELYVETDEDTFTILNDKLYEDEYNLLTEEQKMLYGVDVISLDEYDYSCLPDSNKYNYTQKEKLTETQYNKLTQSQLRDGTYSPYLYRNINNEEIIITEDEYNSLSPSEQSDYILQYFKNNFYSLKIKDDVYRGLDETCRNYFSFLFSKYKSTLHVHKTNCTAINDATYNGLPRSEKNKYYDLEVKQDVYLNMSETCKSYFEPVYESTLRHSKSNCASTISDEAYNELSEEEKERYYDKVITAEEYNSLPGNICKSFYASDCVSENHVCVFDCGYTVTHEVYNSLPNECEYLHIFVREINEEQYNSLTEEEKSNCVKLNEYIKSDFYDLEIDKTTYDSLDETHKGYFTAIEEESNDTFNELLNELKTLANRVIELKRDVINNVKQTFQITCTGHPNSIVYRAVSDDRPIVYHEIHKGEIIDDMDGFYTVECQHEKTNKNSISEITIPTLTTKDSKLFGDPDSNSDFLMRKFEFTDEGTKGRYAYNGTVNHNELMFAVDNRSMCATTDMKKKLAYFIAVNNAKFEKKGSTIPDRFIDGDSTYGYYFGYHIIDKIFDFDTLGWSVVDKVPYFMKVKNPNGNPHGNTIQERDIFEDGLIVMNGLFTGILKNGSVSKYIDYNVSDDKKRAVFEEQSIGNVFNGELYTYRTDGETDAEVEDRMPTKRYLTGSGVASLDDTNGFEKNYLNYAIEDNATVENDMWQHTHKQYCQLSKFDTDYTFKDNVDCDLSDGIDAGLKIILTSDSVNNCREKDKSVFKLDIQNCSDNENLIYYVFDAKNNENILYPLNKAVVENDKYYIDVKCEGQYSSDSARIFDIDHLEYLFNIYSKPNLKSYLPFLPSFASISATIGNVETTQEVKSKYEDNRTEQEYSTNGWSGTGEFEIKDKNFHKPLYAVAITKNNMRTISPVYDYRYICVTLLFGSLYVKQERIDEDGAFDGYEVINTPKMTFDVSNIVPDDDINNILYYFYNYPYDVKFSCKLDDVNTVNGEYTHTAYKDNPKGFTLFDLTEAAYTSLLSIFKHSNGKVGKTIKGNTTVELTDVTGLKHIPDWYGCKDKSWQDGFEPCNSGKEKGCIAYAMKKWVTVVWVTNGGHWVNNGNCYKYVDTECDCDPLCDLYESESDYVRLFEAGDTYKPYDVGDVEKEDCGQGSSICDTGGEGFLGWSRTPDGSDIVDVAEEITLQGEPEEAMIYYAVWSCDIKGVSWYGCEDPVTLVKPELKHLCVVEGTIITEEDMPVSDDPDIVYEWDVQGASYDESVKGYIINAETTFTAICRKSYTIKLRFTNYIDIRNSHIDLVHLTMLINNEEKVLNNVQLGITSPQYNNNSIVVEHHYLKNLKEGDVITVTEIVSAETNDGCNIFDTSMCQNGETCCPRRDYGHGNPPLYEYDPVYEVSIINGVVGSSELRSGIIDIVFIDRAYIDCTKQYDVEFVSENTGTTDACGEYVYQTIHNVCKNEIVQEYRNPSYMKFVGFDDGDNCMFEEDNSRYVFTGWNPDPALTPINPPTGTTVFRFVAQWTIPRFIFSFFVGDTKIKLDREVVKGYTINAVDIPEENDVTPHVPNNMSFTGNWVVKIEFNGSWLTSDTISSENLVDYEILQNTRFYAELVNNQSYIVQFKVGNRVVEVIEVPKNSQNPYVNVPETEDFAQYIPQGKEFNDNWEDQDGTVRTSTEIEALAITQNYYFNALFDDEQVRHQVRFTVHDNDVIPVQNVLNGTPVENVPTINDVMNSEHFQEGDTFNGFWNENGTTNQFDRDYILSLPITKPTIFKAILGVETLTVRFLWNYEEGMETDKDGNPLPNDVIYNNVPYNSELTTPTNPKVIGYDFLGWFVDGNSTPYPVNYDVIIQENTDFNGDWAVQQFITHQFNWYIMNYSRLTIIGITIWLEAVNVADSSQSIECETKIVTGGSFHTGEYRDGTSGSIQGLPDSSDYTYLRPVKANINWEFNGHTGETLITRSSATDMAYIGNGPNLPNHVNMMNSSCVDNINCTDILSIGIYDGEGAPSGPFEVKFYVRVGYESTLVENPPKTYPYGTVLHVSNGTIPSDSSFLNATGYPDKYTLGNWLNNSNPEGQSVTDNVSYTRLASVKMLTVNFNWNDPNNTVTQKSVAYGSTVPSADIPQAVDAPDYPNHTFAGWTPNPAATTITTNNVIFNGQWTENAPDTVSVTFRVEEKNNPSVNWTFNPITVDDHSTLPSSVVPSNSAIVNKTGNTDKYEFDSWEGFSDGQTPAGSPIDGDTTFTAYVRLRKYNVTFINIETENTYSYDYGSTVIMPTNPTRPNLSFGGWRCSVNNLIYVYNDNFSPLTTDTTFTAEWIANISFKLEDEINEVVWDNVLTDWRKSVRIPYQVVATDIPDETSILEATGNKNAYYADGWKNGNPLGKTVNRDVAYTAYVVKKTFDVSFVYGNGQSDYHITVDYGETITMPQDPTYQGHTFNAWSCNVDGNTYTQSHPYTNQVTQNLVFTALWDDNQVTVVFYGLDTTTPLKTQTVNYGEQVTPPEISNDNEDSIMKRFVNAWIRRDDSYEVANSWFSQNGITRNMVFDAKYVNIYKVRFQTAKYEPIISTQKVEENDFVENVPTDEQVINKVAETTNGLVFMSSETRPWRINNTALTSETCNLSEIRATHINAETNYYARLSATVTFDYGEPSSQEDTVLTVEIRTYLNSSQIPTPNPVDGYNFIGWSDGITQRIDENTRFVAQWEQQQVQSATVTWYVCYETISGTMSTVTYGTNEFSDLPYVLKNTDIPGNDSLKAATGEYGAFNGSGNQPSWSPSNPLGAEINGDTSFTATFMRNEYNVQFKLCDESLVQYQNNPVKHGLTINTNLVPNPETEGCTLDTSTPWTPVLSTPITVARTFVANCDCPDEMKTYSVNWELFNYSRFTIIGITIYLTARNVSDASLTKECETYIGTGGDIPEYDPNRQPPNTVYGYRSAPNMGIKGIDVDSCTYITVKRAEFNYRYNGNTGSCEITTTPNEYGYITSNTYNKECIVMVNEEKPESCNGSVFRMYIYDPSGPPATLNSHSNDETNADEEETE